jgi:hypothetical protein
MDFLSLFKSKWSKLIHVGGEIAVEGNSINIFQEICIASNSK